MREKRAAWLTQLEQAGAFAPAFELSCLIHAATGLEEAAQRAVEELPSAQEDAVQALVARRCAGEPLQYILGEWEFYGLPFYVGEGVLIPRGDTETLVDAALSLCKGLPAPRIADFCSGSGCVAVALAKHLPKASVLAVELSDAAYPYLLRNTLRNAAENVTPLHADALAQHAAFRGFDVIVSNPPYIPDGELEALAPEVRREPRMALSGGADGLCFYRALVNVCRERLAPGGWLALECGDKQAAQVRALLCENGYTEIGSRRDLEGFERVVTGRFCRDARADPTA